MKVILQKDVPNLGDAGEIKDVANGYARNYLIPQKLVVIAHAGSQRALEHQKKLIALKTEKRLKDMEAVAEKLKSIGELELEARVGASGKMFGSITAMSVVSALAEKDFQIDKRKIELAEKIKSPGKYQVKVKLAEKIIVPVDLNVVPVEVVEEVKEDEAMLAEAERQAAAEKRAAERKAAEEAEAEAAAAGEGEGEATSETDEASAE